VLARLDAIPGLEAAQVDHRGELLRLVVAEEDVLATVSDELSGLGYLAEPLSGVNASDVRWYAFDDIRDLSREEAEIIARRVTSAFTRSHPLPDSARVRLEQAVADALYSCFAANDLGSGVPTGALRSECCEAVEPVVLPLIGLEAAREYVALLSNDLGA
jgi:hypothetical protein